MKIVIHSERESDIQAIFELTRAAFETLPISNNTEQFIVNSLRDAKALTISLVAKADDKVVGHIAFSPLTISDGSPDWYGLECHSDLKFTEMFCQLIRILETGEPTIFKVLQPLDNARGNILIFRFGRGRSFLKDSLCGSHWR